MSINLSELTEKQRLQEFKRVCKELKSKELPVRTAAIKTALNEPIYLIEGKGIFALLEGISAKKVHEMS